MRRHRLPDPLAMSDHRVGLERAQDGNEFRSGCRLGGCHSDRSDWGNTGRGYFFRGCGGAFFRGNRNITVTEA